MANRIVILGAGIAGAKALQSIHKQFHNDKQTTITVVDKNNYSAFIPMIHELATGSVQTSHLTQPIRGLIDCCLEHFHQAEVKQVDLEQKIVKTSAGDIPYDYLVIAMGSTNNYFGIPGVAEYGIDLKTVPDALNLREHIISRFEQVAQLAIDHPHRRDMLHFVLIGAGYTGVETAGQLADLFSKEMRKLYPEISADEPKVTIVQGNKRILPVLSEQSSKKAQTRLEQLGVHVLTGVRATAVTSEGVSLTNGTVLQSHNVIWTSGILARGGEFFLDEYLEKGRIRVKATLQMEKHPTVFAIGDIAGVIEGGGPHPQTAQAAVQQADLIGGNIKRLIMTEPLEPFRYNHKGDLVPIGNRWAIAEIKKVKLTGFLSWWIRRTVYLMGIMTWSDRIRVVFDWTLNLFTDRDTTKL